MDHCSDLRVSIRALGIPAAKAYEWGNSSKGHWRVARSGILQHALPNAYWTNLGLRGFADNYHRLRNTLRTAGCGPHVRWCGREAGRPRPLPVGVEDDG